MISKISLVFLIAAVAQINAAPGFFGFSKILPQQPTDTDDVTIEAMDSDTVVDEGDYSDELMPMLDGEYEDSPELEHEEQMESPLDVIIEDWSLVKPDTVQGSLLGKFKPTLMLGKAGSIIPSTPLDGAIKGAAGIAGGFFGGIENKMSSLKDEFAQNTVGTSHKMAALVRNN